MKMRHLDGRRRLVGSVLAGSMLAAMVWSGSTPALAQADREYQIKAAFLFNFVRYVQWPDEALASRPGKILIGVLGQSPFGSAIDALEGRQVHDRALEIKHVSDFAAAKSCHLVFVCPSEGARMASLLKELQGQPILTVSDSPAFAQAGGIVELMTVENTVRFKVNLQVARQAKLKIDSQLLNLALQVL